MSDNIKIASIIGMANKANKIVSGEEILRKSIREKKVKLIIIAKDASDNTKKRFSNSASYYDIPYYTVLTKYDFSKSLGWKNRSVIGITDSNFANTLEKLICEVLQLKTGGELFE